jgi:hypothetical protein
MLLKLPSPSVSPYRSLPNQSLCRPPCPLKLPHFHALCAAPGQAGAPELAPDVLPHALDESPPAANLHSSSSPLDAATDAAVLQQMLAQTRSAEPAPLDAQPQPSASAAAVVQRPVPPRSSSPTSYGRRQRSREGARPLDPRLMRLARELVQAKAEKGPLQIRAALLEANLTNSDVRQLLSCLSKLDAADVALAAFT